MIVVYPTTELLRIGLFGLSYNYLRTWSDFVLEQSFVHCQRVDTILIQSSVNFHKRKINEENEDSDDVSLDLMTEYFHNQVI